MRLDCIELQSLEMSIVLLTPRVEQRSLTFPISSSVMQPPTSVLFAKTSRVAPRSRYPLIRRVGSIEQGSGKTCLLQQQGAKLLSAVSDP